MVSAPEEAIRVGRDIRDDVCRRRAIVSTRGRRLRRGAAEAVLLPRRDERTGRSRVDDRRPRAREPEPAARALPAAGDRPHRRRPQARRAEGRARAEPTAAGGAEDVRGGAAGDAARRQQKVDEPRSRRYVRKRDVSVPVFDSRIRVDFVSRGCTRSRGRNPAATAEAVVRLEQLLVVPDVVPALVEHPTEDRLVALQPADEPAGLVGAVLAVEIRPDQTRMPRWKMYVAVAASADGGSAGFSTKTMPPSASSSTTPYCDASSSEPTS